MKNAETLEIITCSYAPDFARCQRLCRSVDRFVDSGIQHTLIVPARDLQRFSPLANHRRRIVATQDVVPGAFHQLPLAQRYWVDGGGWPVRGWIMQQITKLSANYATDAELIMFADSDLQFIRPFDIKQVYRQGSLRLHRMPGEMNEGVHLQWHCKASDLLGLPMEYHGSDYVGQLITWRTSVLTQLQAHITQHCRRPWYEAIAHSLRFSEYTLYGAFVEHVLEPQQAGHFPATDPLCHCCWFREEADELSQGQTAIQPESVALLLQSNLGLSSHEEQSLLTRARVQLAHA